MECAWKLLSILVALNAHHDSSQALQDHSIAGCIVLWSKIVAFMHRVSCRCTNKIRPAMHAYCIHSRNRTGMSQRIFSDLTPSLWLQHSVMTTSELRENPPAIDYTSRKIDEGEAKRWGHCWEGSYMFI